MSQEEKIIGTGKDLLMKGASLLGEACPKCGGLQVKYQERIVCLSCGAPSEAASQPAKSSDVFDDLRGLALKKIEEITKRLSSEQDLAQQELMTSLLHKYLDLVKKIGSK